MIDSLRGVVLAIFVLALLTGRAGNYRTASILNGILSIGVLATGSPSVLPDAVHVWNAIEGGVYAAGEIAEAGKRTQDAEDQTENSANPFIQQESQ